MEAPDPPITVESTLPATSSRPGPVFGSRKGVFQTSISGKYNVHSRFSHPETFVACSEPSSIEITDFFHRTPGRNIYASAMEAPNPLIPVEPNLPATSSRPGPVFEFGEGVFRNIAKGKYPVTFTNSYPEMLVASSQSNLSLYCSSIRTLGRTLAASTLEACNPSTTVEPLLPPANSRPGPVCGIGKQVFQKPTVGKYHQPIILSLPESIPISSASGTSTATCQSLPENIPISNASGTSSAICQLTSSRSETRRQNDITQQPIIGTPVILPVILGPVHNEFSATPSENLLSEFTSLPGRNAQSILGVPSSSKSVAPIAASGHPSRPGPEFRCGLRGSQLATLGKYTSNTELSLPDDDPNSSALFSPRWQHGASTFNSSPGRILATCPEEAPIPLIAVVPYQPAICSRPGPAFEMGDGVFQIPVIGKYDQPTKLPSPESILVSSGPSSHPGHPVADLEDAPAPLEPVMLSADIHHRHRPVPEVGDGSGYSQPANSGDRRSANCTPDDTTKRELSSDVLGSNDALTSSSGLRVYYQNTRGLGTKLDEVYLAVLDGEYDIYVFTETWLDGRINSMQLFGDSFNVYRVDRNADNSNRSRGGGVLVAVSNTLVSCLVADGRFPSIETVWVKVRVYSKNIFIGAAYIPPEKRHDCCTIQLHLDAIEYASSAMGSCDVLLLLGDFNQPGLIWVPSGQGYAFPDPLLSTTTPASRLLLDGTAFHGLRQISLIPNHQSRFLDLVFVNESSPADCLVSEAADVVVPLDAFHPALEISVATSVPVIHDEVLLSDRLNFRKTNFLLLRRYLTQTDWSVLGHHADVDTAVAHYNNLLLDCVTSSVPKCQPPRKPPWSNATLRNLKRLRAQALRAYSNRRCVFSKRAFFAASNEHRCYNKFLYKRHVNRIQQNLRRNPKGFWSFVNTKRKETGLPSRMYFNDITAVSAGDKCSLFARHFSSVFTTSTPTPVEVECTVRDVPLNVVSMDICTVDVQTVRSAIQRTKSTFSPGPSIIPTAVLKKCSDILAAPLAHLFNMSLQQQTFPVQWKRSTMFPVFKKGDKCNVENYRGITSLGVESKVLESVINDQLFAACRHYISSCQHGFFPGRSVETNLVSFTSFCVENIAKKLQVDTIYTDFKAAFDRVSHEILLAKLEKLGCTTRFCKWLQSYLTNRQVAVNIGNTLSPCFTNGSGVPQGSTLGPLLFSLFVNDVTLILQRGGKLFFADDLKIYFIIRNHADCVELQSLLNIFHNWCVRNMMILCISKCIVISFHRTRNTVLFDYNIAGCQLQRVDHVKDLGVILDERLTFTRHYSTTIDKANRQLGFIFKISSEFRDPVCYKALYCSLVRSMLEFASVVWTPYHAVWSNRIEAVQRRFVRYALRYLPWRDPQNMPPYVDRCRLLGLNTLAERRNASQATFVAKIMLAEYDVPELLANIGLYAPSRMLRPRTMLHQESRTTNYAANSGVIAMVRRFNEFSEFFDFNSTSLGYRRRLLQY